jgi:hypothetical protein
MLDVYRPLEDMTSRRKPAVVKAIYITKYTCRYSGQPRSAKVNRSTCFVSDMLLNIDNQIWFVY